MILAKKDGFLITRPIADSQAFASELNRLFGNHLSPLICPMTEIIFEDLAPLLRQCPPNAQAFIATSANALRALDSIDSIDTKTQLLSKDMPFFAIGAHTAQAASAFGFRQVMVADGDLSSLTALIEERCAPHLGSLIYFSGRERQGDIAQLLTGFSIHHAETYRAPALKALPSDIIKAFEARVIKGVSFFSTRAAMIFRNLVKGRGFDLSSVLGFCLSQEIAFQLKSIDFFDIKISAHKEKQSMLDLIGDVYGY